MAKTSKTRGGLPGDRWWEQWLGGLGGLLFPASCIVCDAETPFPAGAFCVPCRQELIEAGQPACPRCAALTAPAARPDLDGACAECRGVSLGFDAALALGPYQGPIRSACLRLKHAREQWLAPALAELLIAAHRPALEAHAGALMVPVPLHWRRRWRRGYNQAEALARALAHRLALEYARPLRRIVATPPLAGLSPLERAKVMRRALAVRTPGAVADRTVLLVDDIMTTGATCSAAARALKRAGAARVVAVVVGRAGRST